MGVIRFNEKKQRSQVLMTSQDDVQAQLWKEDTHDDKELSFEVWPKLRDPKKLANANADAAQEPNWARILGFRIGFSTHKPYLAV